MPKEKSLTALILTRPTDQNTELIDGLKNSPVTVIEYPFLEIKPLKDYTLFDSLIGQLSDFDILIFISTNAVKFFIERMDLFSIKLPENIILASIGPATKSVLSKHFNHEVCSPEVAFDSEHLLEHPIFKNIQKKNILIVRGEGGRETLKEGLEQKGATVIYAECYLRKDLPISFDYLRKITKGYEKIFFLITSNEIGTKLINDLSLSEKAWLTNCCCIVNHIKTQKTLINFFRVILKANTLKPENIQKLLKIST